MQLMDKVALITGSTRGIGAAIARLLDKQGMKLIITSATSQSEGQALAKQLTHAEYVTADLTNNQDCDRLIDTTLKHFSQLDVLINNAAISQQIPHHQLDLISDELFYRHLNVNLLGPWRLIQRAAAYLEKQAPANIINISSIAGTSVMGSSIPYAVSKAALNHMTKLLAKTLAPSIRVNAIAPGFVATERTQNWHDLQQDYFKRVPLQEICTPEIIAKTVLYVLENQLITGNILEIDGGYHLS